MNQNYDPANDPQAFEPPQEPPYDPEIDGPVEQPAVDGQQQAAGQPATEKGQQQAEADYTNQPNQNQPNQQGQEMLGATGDGQDGNLEKDPSEWATGDQPATESQKSYIDAMAKQAAEQIPANLTKAQASEQIDRLKKITGM